MITPIFIIACPRSGTSILLDILTGHEKFAWISNRLNQFPNQLWLAWWNKIYDLPIWGKRLTIIRRRSKLLPFPVEPWGFWNYYLSKFQLKRFGILPPLNRKSSDLTEEEIVACRYAIEKICKYQRKKIFISKYTDFPRIKYILRVFPNAKFIHIIRDGRAVANSYSNKIQSGKFATWEERDWWVRGWPNSWKNEWKK